MCPRSAWLKCATARSPNCLEPAPAQEGLGMRLNVADFRARARGVLPRFVFDYLEGGAEDERCLRRNAQDLERLALLPAGLRDTTRIDTGLQVFGPRWAAPLGVAPVGGRKSGVAGKGVSVRVNTGG